jgi:hypothetical protein
VSLTHVRRATCDVQRAHTCDVRRAHTCDVRRATCYVLGFLVAASALVAQQPAGPFRVERPIVTTGVGPQRLTIDVPLLSRAQPVSRVYPTGQGEWRAEGGLADLRIFDTRGREVPYVLTHASRVPEWARATVLPQAVTKTTSGFEADLGAVRNVDMVRVDGLPPSFLKRVQLEGSGDRQRWTLLAGEGTLFDLPQEGLQQLMLPFATGAFRYLRATWDDTNSGRLPLPSSVSVRIALEPALGRRTLAAAAPFERRPSEPGQSRYRIRLPAAGLPVVAARLDVGPGHVFRLASISEARFASAHASPMVLGRERLARIERDGVTAAALRIRITQPHEIDLDLVIDDGNNPPLDLKGVELELAELPWIYFEAPAGPLVARYGRGPGAKSPVYDLEVVKAGLKLGTVPEARWGEAVDVSTSASVAAPQLPGTGAAIDPSGFRYRRTISAPPGTLAALSLDAAVLAHSRGSAAAFADVRIQEQSGRQVPYLLERRDEPLTVPLSLQSTTPKLAALRSEPGHNRSLYQINLPYAGLPTPRLVLETSERVFERSVQVVVERPPDRRHREPWLDVAAGAEWRHASQEMPAPALVMPLTIVDTSALLVVIDEGDNRPLAVTRAQLLLPSWRVRFFSPPAQTAGEARGGAAAGSPQQLSLLYGHDQMPPPRYDLGLLASVVMGAEAREVEVAPESGSAIPASPVLVTPRMFWIGLGLAVLVLLAVIVKLVVGSSADPSPPPPPSP